MSSINEISVFKLWLYVSKIQAIYSPMSLRTAYMFFKYMKGLTIHTLRAFNFQCVCVCVYVCAHTRLHARVCVCVCVLTTCGVRSSRRLLRRASLTTQMIPGCWRSTATVLGYRTQRVAGLWGGRLRPNPISYLSYPFPLPLPLALKG